MGGGSLSLSLRVFFCSFFWEWGWGWGGIGSVGVGWDAYKSEFGFYHSMKMQPDSHASEPTLSYEIMFR